MKKNIIHKTLSLVLTFAIALSLTVVLPPMASAADGYTSPVGNYPNIWVTFGAAGRDYISGRKHIGVDISAVQGDPIYAVMDGTVYDARMNVGGYGYGGGQGGAIVIKHTNLQGGTFYALYGHLQSLQVKAGDNVSKGQRIASIGPYNGTHLHFGVSTKLQSNPWQGFVTPESAAIPDGWVDPVSYLDTYCGTSSSQPTASSNIPNGTYYIQGKGSGRNVDVSGGGRDNGQSVWIYDANGTTAQQWAFERQSNGAYKIKAAHSGKLMEVRNSSYDNGADVAQWDDANILTQQWYVYDKGDGWYEFVNANSGKALDVAGGGTANGTNVWQYDRNNTDAQRFKLLSINAITQLKINSIAVANPTVKVGDYCWMTVVTSPDITNIWIVNETNGDTVYQIVRSYAVRSDKGWDIGWQLGRAGYRTGYIVASNGRDTVRMAFNCTAVG